jgi:cation:H+ antiporter
MTADLFLLLFGLVLLLAGGEAMLRGATGLAQVLGMSQLTIGLTVVAFGTSAPELAVNGIAAWRGRSEISFGNIIGSNMANIGLIVAVTALTHPILIQRVLIVREIPMMLFATAAAVVMAFDGWLSTGTNMYDRADGILLLMLFGVFLYYTAGDFLAQRSRELLRAEDQEESGLLRPPHIPGRPLLRYLAITAVGLAGVPEVIVGLTVLAVGTSLPELAASIVASLRGHVALAIGNVVGSNIFNLLLVGGVTATLRPIPVPALGGTDLMLLVVLSLALMGVSMTRRRQIVRTEGVVLLSIYLGYLIWRVGAPAEF